MKEELINEIFEEFNKEEEIIKEQLRSGLDVIVLNKQGEDGEFIRIMVHYDDGIEKRRRWWDE